MSSGFFIPYNLTILHGFHIASTRVSHSRKNNRNSWCIVVGYILFINLNLLIFRRFTRVIVCTVNIIVRMKEALTFSPSL